MGRKKIQITRIMDERNRQVSPRGMAGWMSVRVGGKGGVEEDGKEKHPTPDIDLNNDGLLGVWAISELGDGVVYWAVIALG